MVLSPSIISPNAHLYMDFPICVIQFILYLTFPPSVYEAYAEITQIYAKGPLT